MTPDALGAHWDGGRVIGPVRADVNGTALEQADAAQDFGALIAAAAHTRGLGAGTVLGAGWVAAASLKTGDTVRIWMEDERRHSIFGAIEQTMG